MKNLLITLLVMFCMGNLSFSQESETLPISEGLQDLPKAELGTYQFVQISKVKEIFTTEHYDELLRMIEAERHPTQLKSFTISPYTILKVLPTAEIEAEGFQPLPEFVEEHIDGYILEEKE